MQTKEKLLLYILAAINFCNIMDFMIMMPLGPQLMRIFEITPHQFSLIVSSYTVSAFVSGLLSSIFVDRFDRKKVLLFLYSGFIIGTAFCGLADSFYALITARIFTGLFGGVLGAVVLASVGDSIPFERRGQAMGIVMAAFSVASVFGVPFGLFLANNSAWGWQAPFLFLAILGSPIFFMIWKFLPPIRSHLDKAVEKRENAFIVIGHIFTDRNQRKALFLAMVMVLGHFTIIPFLSPYMVANVGFSESQLQYIYMVGGILTVFTSPQIGKLADKFGKQRIFISFALLCLIPVFLITNMPPIHIALALSVSGLFFIFSSGRMIPLQAMITASVDPKHRGSFMSINSSVQQLMAGAGAYLAGEIIEKGSDGKLLHYDIVGYFSIAMALIAMLISLGLRSFSGEKF